MLEFFELKKKFSNIGLALKISIFKKEKFPNGRKT